MTHEQATKWLQTLAQHWRMRVYFSLALKALGITLLASAALAHWATSHYALATALCFVIFMLSFLTGWFARRRKRIDAHLIARHLDLAVPQCEESCALLLKSETALTFLEKLQRERLLRALERWRGEVQWPSALLRGAGLFLAACAVLAILLNLGLAALRKHEARTVPAFVSASTASHAQSNAIARVALIAVEIEITPPAYTNQPQRVVSDFNLRVEENARLAWHLGFNRALANGILLLNAKDTLHLQPEGESKYAAHMHALENSFYQFLFAGEKQETQASHYFRLEVLADEAPRVSVTVPPPRTVIMPGQPPRVNMQAEIEDDYGLAHVEAFATLARGTGEAVRFREAQLHFEKIDKVSARQWQLQSVLDLAQLGMAPGDELYFFIEARDNREPAANRSRSETFFIVWQDTASAMIVESASLMINPLPEYFRSQRLIIIDTEKLLQDRPRISVAEFQKRSQNLGFDQQALRMRYSEFLGEEREEGGAPEPEHEGEVIDKSAADTKASAVEKIIEEFEHQHDTEENATLFAPSVKSMLQAALGEMWNAELRLRTNRPETALPYEYRALALLKSVQQHSRVYVQRVGFEATPIKVEEKRLTGELEKISNRTAQRNAPRDSTLQHARAGLSILRQTERAQAAPTPGELATLEQAGGELARAALKNPAKDLRALQNFHAVLADFKNQRAPCEACLLAAQRALWQLLPPAEPAPGQRNASSSTLAQKYYALIFKFGNRAP